MSNKGYIGYSRSVRSEMAIENYEVPKSLINRDLIDNFFSDLEEDKYYYNEEQLSNLKKFKLCHWKFIADKYIQASSWHHTGSYYNKTNHYSLFDIADKLLELKDNIEELYAESKIKKEEIKYSFGVIKVNIWGEVGTTLKL